MSRRRRSLTSVLARSSNTEELRLGLEVIRDLTTCLIVAIGKIHTNFSLAATKARGFPAQISPRAKYLCTVERGSAPCRPTQEITRKVHLWGYYEPPVSKKKRPRRRRLRSTIPLGRCEFFADCEIYCHSPSLGWELGQLTFQCSDEGWHEPMTMTFLTETWFDGKNQYRVELNAVYP